MSQWDQYAELYHQGIGEEGDELHHLIDPFIFKWLGNLRGQIILDAGCGNGYLSRKLSKFSKKVVGLDSSQKLLSIAQSLNQRKNLTFQLADLGKTLPFKPQEFHTIIAHMVLQYLPSIKTTAQEFSRILKPRGKLIISVDHPTHPLINNSKFLTKVNYFEEKRHTKKSLWDKAILTYYHRPIMAYFKPFKAAGLNLTELKELREDKHPDIPRILFLVYERPN